MNLPALATDNITEILHKIIEFTQIRQKILIRNINAVNTWDFVPKDLDVDEFSKLMCLAIEEHSKNKRLVLCDGKYTKFGAGGSFNISPIIDEKAGQILKKDRNEYLRNQILKLLENSLNQRIATQLLRTKHSSEYCLERYMN